MASFTSIKPLLCCAALLLFSLPFESCAVVTQAEVEEGQQEMRIAPVDGSLAVSLKTATLDPAKKGAIAEDQSYAIAKDGRRYGIVVTPNEYARNYPERSYFTSDYIWLKTSSGQKAKWTDGEWRLKLVLKGAGKMMAYEARFKLQSGAASLSGYHSDNF
jgi:hypothetical protein